jgi:hypothetical protein
MFWNTKPLAIAIDQSTGVFYCKKDSEKGFTNLWRTCYTDASLSADTRFYLEN